jgi:hypothetical protein
MFTNSINLHLSNKMSSFLVENVMVYVLSYFFMVASGMQETGGKVI